MFPKYADLPRTERSRLNGYAMDANAGCAIIYVDGMPKRSVQAETLHNNYHILETSYLPRLGTVKLR